MMRGMSAKKYQTKGAPKLTEILAAIGVLIVAIGFVGGILYRISDHRNFNDVYPRLEQLIAIYSLTAWKHPEQSSPEILRNGEYASDSFWLDCEKFDWDSSSKFSAGDLLNCFLEKQREYIAVEGQEFETYKIVPDIDIWYEFKWISLFGYELEVFVNDKPDLWNSLRPRVIEEFVNPCAEEGDYSDMVETYLFRIKGLSASEEVSFLASNKSVKCHADGSFSTSSEWVAHLEDGNKFTTGEMNKFIQIVARELEISEVDLSKSAPLLETLWRRKDAGFAKDLLAEMKNAPDLSALTNFLTK